MKRGLLFAAAALALDAGAVTLTPGNVEIVAVKGAPQSVGFAAKEMSAMLGNALGSPVKVVEAPTEGKASIILGSNSWTRAAGIDTAALAHDEFVIKSEGGKVYIAGRDALGGYATIVDRRERATLFGAYEFLSRFAGVRMYFPGELGTIIPKAASLDVPDGTLKVRPAYSIRRYGPKDGTVPAELIASAGAKSEDEFKRINKLRERLETSYIPCCHGQLYSRFYRRFAKEHPEYYIMGKDGKRNPTEAVKGKPVHNREHLCHSSAVWNEIYLDAKAYLTDQPPDVRKIPSEDGKKFVRGPGAYGKYYDVMPNDGLKECFCPECQARYNKKIRSYASDLIWARTAEVGRRLKADGVKGYITQMAYGPCSAIPDFDVPDNVKVMVAQSGPWSPAKRPDGADRDELVKGWAKKTGGKVWLWTYPDKINERRCPDIPQISPKAWGRYYGGLSEWIFGAFAESESDRWIYNYLNYHVFSQICWNPDADVEAILDEHHRLMFGAAAPQMKEFLESLEDKWVNGLMHNVRMTSVGPETVMPSYYEMWAKIYSPEALARYAKLFADAAAKVPPGSLEARRIALFKAEILDPLAAKAKPEHDSLDVAACLERRKAFSGDGLVFADAADAPLKPWSIWPKPVYSLARSAEKGPVSSAPLEFTSTTQAIAMAWLPLKIKPGAKYRLSYFIRLENVVARVFGGIDVSLQFGKSRPLDLEALRFDGTTGWVYREAEFTAPEDMKPKDGVVKCTFRRAEGKAFIDGLRVDEIAGGTVRLEPGRVQVVAAANCAPSVRFAAQEMTNFLAQALGAPVPIAAAPDDARGVNVILGDNEWSRAEGLDPAPLVRDGFWRLAKGGRVYLVGVDDPKEDPARMAKGLGPVMFERATLFAAYDFLERFAGCRFFFPGDIGTVVPRSMSIEVPEGRARTEPVFTERYYSSHRAGGIWYDSSVKMAEVQGLNRLRLRYGTQRTPCCHGQRAFHYVPRFAKEHPDWFCLQKNGERYLVDTGKTPHCRNGKLCYSSPIREEIYQDAKAYLTGRPASSRGLARWGGNCVGGRYVDLMPEDSLMECHCEKCQAAYNKNEEMFATDQMWNMIADFGNRLIREGVKGDITMMAYHPYRRVPAVKLPPNVQVMVAERGPWSVGTPDSLKRQLDEIKAWAEKLGHKVWLWTYPGKYGGKFPDIPQISPRAYAKFFSLAEPWIKGGYAEIETDRFMFDALNVYVYSRLGWDPHLDIEALLDDYHSKLFGAAAPHMKAAFDLLEEKWMKDVQSCGTIDTPLGPVMKSPSFGDLFTKIYSAKTMHRLDSLLDAAARAVSPDSREGRAVAVTRKEVFEPLARKSADVSVEAELKRRASRTCRPIFKNWSMDVPGSWGNSVKDGSLTFDKECKVAGASSVKLTTSEGADKDRYRRVTCTQKTKLKKGRRYRLSYFAKCENVVPYNRNEGAGLCIWEGRDLYTKHPLPLLTGTFGWIHLSHVFTARDEDVRFEFRITEATGTMWLDEILLEAVE